MPVYFRKEGVFETHVMKHDNRHFLFLEFWDQDREKNVFPVLRRSISYEPRDIKTFQRQFKGSNPYKIDPLWLDTDTLRRLDTAQNDMIEFLLKEYRVYHKLDVDMPVE
jgi:hypothetical protein